MSDTFLNVLLLSASILLTVGRSIFSKSVSGNPFGTRRFFLVQAITFGVAALLMAMLSIGTAFVVSPLSWLLALLYGVCLISSQWCYTAALRNGNTSICATVYSFGFFLPTLSGMLFFEEELTPFKVVGLLLLIPALLCSVRGGGKAGEGKYILPLLIAMLSSGGLGLLQKVQQHSPVAGEKNAFLSIAFLIAALSSLVAALPSRTEEQTALPPRHMAAAATIGICFGAANLLNTTLAGRMDSAVFFPVQNIAVIVLCTLLGLLLYHEKLRRRDIGTFFFGLLAILLLNL
ncbi:MAG: EamA family transporter [Clostridia bacterium]|nr:EamA family transporter [Clostridia bacterium]